MKSPISKICFYGRQKPIDKEARYIDAYGKTHYEYDIIVK